MVKIYESKEENEENDSRKLQFKSFANSALFNIATVHLCMADYSTAVEVLEDLKNSVADLKDTELSDKVVSYLVHLYIKFK